MNTQKTCPGCMRENVAEGDCPYCGVEPAAEKRNVSSLPDPAVHESQTGHLLREHRTPTVPSPSQPVRQVANKPNKRRRILLPILISLAALLLCVGIFLSTQFFGSSVPVSYTHLSLGSRADDAHATAFPGQRVGNPGYRERAADGEGAAGVAGRRGGNRLVLPDGGEHGPAGHPSGVL